MCFWEDDISQLRWPDLAGGANHPSLIEAQRNVVQLGAVEARLTGHVRAARANEPIDERWRTFDEKLDVPEPRVAGVDYGSTYRDDRTSYHYWSAPVR